MSIRNRELSQFGSFIYVENSTQEIGITTEALPFVGIGTTNPHYKLDIVGNANVSGFVSASTYYLNGNELIDADIASWTINGFNDNIYRLNGNVGIATTNPQYPLDVFGDIKASKLISTAENGTPPFEVSSLTLVTHLNADYLRGKVAPSGDIVGTNDTQTITNKSINLSNNTLTGTRAEFNSALSDDNFATINGTETLSNKTLTSPTIISIVNNGTKTVPTGIGTFVITGSTGTVTSGMIVDGTIVNSDISASASIAISKLAESTISGISLGNNLNNLTKGSYITYNSGTTYNGSTAKTIGVAATTLNTANTIVSRNASGDFSAGSINCSYLTATFDINSASDENLKTNIKTVENALDTITSLRGVSFDWKENGKSSYGVIAQELEKVLPELVTDSNTKSVNYNGIIGVLIESIKELKSEIDTLKNL